MSDSDRNFLSRWSRRKSAHRQGGSSGPDGAARLVTASTLSDAQVGPAQSVADAESTPDEDRLEPRFDGAQECSPIDGNPAPLEADSGIDKPLPPIESLTPDSDFSAFTQAHVDGSTQARALKRLFVDPHFNRIDEMDIDIEDFGIFEEISPQMLRSMEQARSLGFFDDEEREADLEGAAVSAPDLALSSQRQQDPAQAVEAGDLAIGEAASTQGERTAPGGDEDPPVRAEPSSRQNRADNS